MRPDKQRRRVIAIITGGGLFGLLLLAAMQLSLGTSSLALSQMSR